METPERNGKGHDISREKQSIGHILEEMRSIGIQRQIKCSYRQERDTATYQKSEEYPFHKTSQRDTEWVCGPHWHVVEEVPDAESVVVTQAPCARIASRYRSNPKVRK